jgi:hypothetical protein
MNTSTFDLLSAFYLDLWQYINTFFNDTRWSQINAPQKPEFRDRFAILEAGFARLRENVGDALMAEQVRHDFDAIRVMRAELNGQSGTPSEEWLRRADKLRTYAQEVGLRYAEMAAARAEARE